MKNNIALKQTGLSQKTRIKKMACLVWAVVMVVMLTCTCFAADDDAWGKAKNVTGDVVKDLQGFALSGAILAGTICALTWLLSKDQRKVDMASTWGVRITLGLLAVYLIPAIMNTIVSYVK